MFSARKVRYEASAIRGENLIVMIRSIARSARDRTSTIIAIATNLPQSVRRLVFAARSDLKSSAARLDSAPSSLSRCPWSTLAAVFFYLFDSPPPHYLYLSSSSPVSTRSRSYNSNAGFFGALGKTLISLGWNGGTMCTSGLHARFLRPCRETLYAQSWALTLYFAAAREFT